MTKCSVLASAFGISRWVFAGGIVLFTCQLCHVIRFVFKTYLDTSRVCGAVLKAHVFDFDMPNITPDRLYLLMRNYIANPENLVTI